MTAAFDITKPPSARRAQRRSTVKEPAGKVIADPKDALVHVRLTWPDGATQQAAEFSITMGQALSLFLDKKIVVNATEHDMKEGSVERPSARLRRAVKSAEGIKQPRFKSTAELFSALEADEA